MKFTTRFKSILLATVLCGGLSCSTSTSNSVDDSAGSIPPGLLRIDVFSARGFLGGSDYERYYLSDSVLWRECGNVERNKQTNAKPVALEGDSVLSKDPQLHIRERRVEKLGAKERRAAAIAADVLLQILTAQAETLPAPGSVFSLADPGVVEMMVSLGDRKQRVITSVDAVADGESKPLSKAHELFAILRGIGPQICGSETFFGIERRVN